MPFKAPTEPSTAPLKLWYSRDQRYGDTFVAMYVVRVIRTEEPIC